MCLVAFSLGQSRRYPLVIAANRDEYLDRPTVPLDWWQPWLDGPRVLSGQDLQAGGTWMGATAEGRVALVTNVRQPFTPEAHAPSRGSIVLNWLRGDLPAERFWPRTALTGYAPFNLLAADFPAGEIFWTSNMQPHPQRLAPGLYGLSNAALDTPWPKVLRLKQALGEAVRQEAPLPAFCDALLAALADPTPAADVDLPYTGVPQATERMLSAAFIRSPDGRYGTRCSTLLICEAQADGIVLHMLERQHQPEAAQRSFQLTPWPPGGLPLPGRSARR